MDCFIPYINKDGDVEEVCVGTGKRNDLQYYYDRPRLLRLSWTAPMAGVLMHCCVNNDCPENYYNSDIWTILVISSQ